MRKEELFRPLLLTLLFWSLVVLVATRQIHAQVKYHAKGQPVYVQSVDTNKYPIYFHVRSVTYTEPCSMVLSGSDGQLLFCIQPCA